MKEYYVTIMSIDPDDTSEDNHQKYGYKIEASNPEEAKAKAKEKLGGLPIFWIRVE